MDQVLDSCNRAADYPQNLIRSNTYAFVAQSYSDKLTERQGELFHNPEKAALDFWECDDSASGMFTEIWFTENTKKVSFFVAQDLYCGCTQSPPTS